MPLTSCCRANGPVFKCGQPVLLRDLVQHSCGGAMEKLTIKLSEVRFAVRACETAGAKQREADAADEIKKAAMLTVFEPLLGVKSLAQLQLMSRDEICKLAQRRVKKGEVELEGFELAQLFDVIEQSACRRNVSWKEAFLAELGEARAKELQGQAMPSYSYKFV